MDTIAHSEIPVEKKERPGFLTALCILTFIGCGIMIISYLFQVNETFFLSAQEQIQKIERELEQAENMMPGITERTIEMMLELEEHKVPNWILAFVGNVLSLMGAIMMWKLHKTGFWIYTLAEIVPFLLSISIFNGLKGITGMFSMFGSAFEEIGKLIVVIILIFDVAFIGMYATNLKRMR